MRNEGSVTLETRLPVGVGRSYTSSSIANVDWPKTHKSILLPNPVSIVQQHQHQQCVPKDTVDSLLEERDTRWRLHERAQISFLQDQHTHMLKTLHAEINSLQQKCTEAITDKLDREERRRGRSEERRTVEEDSTIQELQIQLHKAEKEMELMRQTITVKIPKMQLLEDKLEDSENRLRDEREANGLRMRDMQEELKEKSALIAHLSSQVHQLKLKEAVDRHNLRSISIPRPASTTSYTSVKTAARAVHLPAILSSRPASVLSTSVTIQPKPLHPASSRYVRYDSASSRHVPRSQSAVLPSIGTPTQLGIEKQASTDQIHRNQQRSSFKRAKKLSQDTQHLE